MSDLFPGDEEFNRLSRRNSLVPITFTNLKGQTVRLKVKLEFGNAEHIGYLRTRELQLAGECPIATYTPHAKSRAQFFQCVNPKEFNPDKYDHPACMRTHFADWNEVIECKCGYLYKWKHEGIYRIFERPDESEPDDGDWDYFMEPD